MKRIEATIQPHRLNAVVRALYELPHFPGFTLTDLAEVIRICPGERRENAV